MTAYGMQFSRGDNILIAQAIKLLPEHNLWLLLVPIGLVSHYRKLKVKGKIGSSDRVVRLSAPGLARQNASACASDSFFEDESFDDLKSQDHDARTRQTRSLCAE